MTLTARAHSAATADRLWTVVSDVLRWPEHLPTFDTITEIGNSGTTGELGRRFAVRQPKLPAATWEVTAWSPGSSFTWVARSRGVTTTATHAVNSTETGSDVLLTIAWSGPLATLARVVAGRTTQRMIDTEARTLARVAETE